MFGEKYGQESRGHHQSVSCETEAHIEESLLPY